MNNFIAAAFVIIYYSITFFLIRRTRFSAHNLCLCGIVIAMTLVLETIRIPLPTGAAISPCSPIPLMFLAIVADFRLAVIAGWACGILAVFFVPGWQLVHWGQFFVEHMVCFSCLGYTAIWGTGKKHKLIAGITLASALKITGHLISGVIFFSQNAWDGWGAWGYSLAYNLSQNVPLCILSGIIIMLLPIKTMKQTLNRR